MMSNNNSYINKETKENFKEIIQWINAVLLALIIALLLRGFLFEPVMVKGDSMQDTLFDEQRLIVYKLGYYYSAPKHGDIIVLQHQEGILRNISLFNKIPILKKIVPDFKEVNYVKRVIGLPGDVIDIKGGHVYVNEKMLNEPYSKGTTDRLGMKFPQRIPENSVFVLGDNRQNSSDSRMIGLIDHQKIKGKAIFRIYPFENWGNIYINNKIDNK